MKTAMKIMPETNKARIDPTFILLSVLAVLLIILLVKMLLTGE